MTLNEFEKVFSMGTSFFLEKNVILKKLSEHSGTQDLYRTCNGDMNLFLAKLKAVYHGNISKADNYLELSQKQLFLLLDEMDAICGEFGFSIYDITADLQIKHAEVCEFISDHDIKIWFED